MKRVRVHDPVEVPPLLRHLVTHFVDVDTRIPRRERNDRRGRVSEYVHLPVELRLDAPRDLPRCADNRAARFQVSAVDPLSADSRYAK